ncbi:MAG: tyrosine-type recombinase/integrase [Desulfobacteraceae bacterium]|nr:tyrosine-type recombinase/integrase [Desulfobacteraceae bacterium]
MYNNPELFPELNFTFLIEYAKDWKKDFPLIKCITLHYPMTPALRESLWIWCDYRFLKCSWDEENVFVCFTETAVCEPYYGKAFTNRQHFMKRLCKKAGVKPFGFHAIRHLSATVLYHKGKELYYLQRFLRHKDPMTTQRYLHRLGLESLRQGINDGFSNSEQQWAPEGEKTPVEVKKRNLNAVDTVFNSQSNVIIFPGKKYQKNNF